MHDNLILFACMNSLLKSMEEGQIIVPSKEVQSQALP
jgi:hypothetical protein